MTPSGCFRRDRCFPAGVTEAARAASNSATAASVIRPRGFRALGVRPTLKAFSSALLIQPSTVAGVTPYFSASALGVVIFTAAPQFAERDTTILRGGLPPFQDDLTEKLFLCRIYLTHRH